MPAIRRNMTPGLLFFLFFCLFGSPPAGAAAFRKDVLSLTNVERAKLGLRALKSDGRLDKVADARAGELIRYYDGNHLRPDKRKWNTILAEFKISWTACGENIAHGQQTAKAEDSFSL